MPIYAYQCESCGYAKDVLQKISDTPLQDCPQCHAPTFKKQVTAAGFQLKGSGWYVTDFKGGSAPSTVAAPATKTDTPSESAASAPAPVVPSTPSSTT
ncbi:MAG: zinc ribbon domain-containing protein [Rhodoferax sp.]|nr:zinc ribbon domain-containing protein [Rhodoferax sp.]